MFEFMVVNAIGILFILLILWWFWFSKKQPIITASLQTPIEIIAEGGTYLPNQIAIPPKTDIVLRFIRKDPSPCAESVVFPELGISATLAVDRATDVKVNIASHGEYSFSCAMGMYQGKLIVGEKQ